MIKLHSEIERGEVGFVDFVEAGGMASQSSKGRVMIFIVECEVDGVFVKVLSSLRVAM